MKNQKTAGLVLILVGMAVPLLLLLFTSGYDPQRSFIANILTVRIVLYDPGSRTAQGSNPQEYGAGRKGAMTLPYRFPLAFCIFLIFLGIRQLDQSRRKSVPPG